MGEVFAGRYELVDPIGRGGVGAVWRAWDHRRRRYVAAKVLQQSDAHSLLRFVREQALRIDHPHVLAPASWAADDDKVLFTMDLVAGGSLVHLVGDYGPLPPAFVCTLLDQLLAGLAAVHAEGVVHRDIKPANVLLEATGTGRPRLRLSDFGIAMRLGEPRLTETNLVVGTPGYIAPEQMMGAEPDFPADLFAVGLVALYLLQGAKPDTKALVQYFAEHGTPGAPRGVPEPLWQVVATLLQPDPAARFRTATGARKALAAAVELLPEPGPDDELIEIFDQLGPLPPGFGPDGPLRPAPGVTVGGSGTGGSRAGSARPEGLGTAGSEAEGSEAEDSPASREGGPSRAGAEEGSGPARQGRDGRAGESGRAGEPGESGESGRAGGSGESGKSGGTGGTGGFDGFGGAEGSAAGVVPADPRHGFGPPHGSGSLPAPDAGPSGPVPVPPPGVPEPDAPARPAGMSDTGSFHLPPPQATGTASRPPAVRPRPAQPQPRPQPPAQARPHPRPSPAPGVSPDAHTQVLSSPRPPTPPRPDRPLTPAPHHRADASTASYTAQAPQVPRHRAARPRRPGPPAKVAVPLLLLALACYAVGFWALTRI
ncbi:serine/threonine-protein kinase [Streptomyces glaucus]|uniref:non-specific serine/threonine protein kinase n=1 Tax=Streptomyces glaucus TaxID=284029 RepID=A0ABP5WJT8_9ACTN